MVTIEFIISAHGRMCDRCMCRVQRLDCGSNCGSFFVDGTHLISEDLNPMSHRAIVHQCTSRDTRETNTNENGHKPKKWFKRFVSSWESFNNLDIQY